MINYTKRVPKNLFAGCSKRLRGEARAGQVQKAKAKVELGA
jgi:hypothetical protein